MSRALLGLAGDRERKRAHAWVDQAPVNSRVEFKAPKRTLDQNSRFWAMLSDIARQVTWHGMKLAPDDWRLVFLDALKRETRIVPNIDGNGFVNLGRSSSDLSKAEFADLFLVIEAFGARHGVTFTEPAEVNATAHEGADGNEAPGLRMTKNLSTTRAGGGDERQSSPDGGI